VFDSLGLMLEPLTKNGFLSKFDIALLEFGFVILVEYRVCFTCFDI
jgi:hypothetical protein